MLQPLIDAASFAGCLFLVVLIQSLIVGAGIGAIVGLYLIFMRLYLLITGNYE